MAQLMSLPDELLLAILTEAVYVRSVRRAIRLRLVCRRFSNLATTAIYQSRILDGAIGRNTRPSRAPEFWAQYLAYLALAHSGRISLNLSKLLHIAQCICRYRKVDADDTNVAKIPIAEDELKECLVELCKMAFRPNGHGSELRTLLELPQNNATGGNNITTAATDSCGEVPDWRGLEFNHYVLSAAAWLGEVRLASKLIEEGYDWCFNDPLWPPICAACYRGHLEIVKLILARRSLWPTIYGLIVEYFNDHTDIIDFGLDLVRQSKDLHRGEKQSAHDEALKTTCRPETFKQLMYSSEPYNQSRFSDRRYDPSRASSYWRWISDRVFHAAKMGSLDFIRYLLDESRYLLDDDSRVGVFVGQHLEDHPMFQSRYPVEFSEPYRHCRDREIAATHLSQAASRGDAQAVRLLLNAGFKNDRAIRFAAMCGSKTILKTLWKHGGHQEEAVQEALAVAVDREDTAMLELLVELGARLDDDVRVAVTQKARDEGLESTVEILASS